MLAEPPSKVEPTTTGPCALTVPVPEKLVICPSVRVTVPVATSVLVL